MAVSTSNRIKKLYGTWCNHYYQAWLLRQMRTYGLDAAKVAKLRRRASLYIDEKAVSTKSKPTVEAAIS